MNQILKVGALKNRQIMAPIHYPTRPEQKKLSRKRTRKKVDVVQTAAKTKFVEIKSVSHRRNIR